MYCVCTPDVFKAVVVHSLIILCLRFELQLTQLARHIIKRHAKTLSYITAVIVLIILHSDVV